MRAFSPPGGVPAAGNGGEGWIRTSVRLRGQIYSLLPLTTRPPLQRRGTWPRGPVLSILPTSGRCRGSTRNRGIVGPPAAGAPLFNHSPRMTEIGAGEGNRTLVVSLEGFCSTIELHPPARKRRRPMPLPAWLRQPPRNPLSARKACSRQGPPLRPQYNRRVGANRRLFKDICRSRRSLRLFWRPCSTQSW